MLNKQQLHGYQREAVQYIKRKKRCGLFLEMGLGKTAITLTAIEELIFEEWEVQKVLIIAPKQVAVHTWANEVERWTHLNKIRLSVAVGSEKERKQALTTPAEVYTINRENVQWLTQQSDLPFDYDMVVVDELSSFKNPSAKRWKALRKASGSTPYFVGLTGTPSPNGYMDLWAECFLIDNGKALERTLTAYRTKYFRPLYGKGYITFAWGLQHGAQEQIERKVAEVAMSMQAKDYLTLPPVNYVDVPVYLTEEELAIYKRFERERVMELNEGEAITAGSAGVLCNKLLQFCSGCVYIDEPPTLFHPEGQAPAPHTPQTTDNSTRPYVQSGITSKFARFMEFLDETSENILIPYTYAHEYDRLCKIEGAKSLQEPKVFKEWNDGKVSILLGHPKSMGHGLNLQAGGRIVAWYGLTWSLEEWQQTNARLYRQGQEKPVFVYRFYCVGTIEERLIKALSEKRESQQALMDAVKHTIQGVAIK